MCLIMYVCICLIMYVNIICKTEGKWVNYEEIGTNKLTTENECAGCDGMKWVDQNISVLSKMC